ncbi:unnamed protein product [Prunus brigantina]
MNQALLSKIGWRVQNKDNGLWAKIFEAKYLKGASILDTDNSTKKSSSHTWKGIVHGVELLLKGMRWRIGLGDQIRFWKDNWCSDIPLLHQDGVLNVCDADCVVSSFYLHNWWDISKLREALTKDLVQQIVSIPVGCIGAGGVIRGANGIWTCGFAANLGKGQILEAELWGLYFGLHLACDKGISNLLIEMDAAVVVSLVQQVGTLSCHPLATLI